MRYSEKLQQLLSSLLSQKEVDLLVKRAKVLGYVSDEKKMKKIYETIFPHQYKRLGRFQVEALINRALGDDYKRDLLKNEEILTELRSFLKQYFSRHPQVNLRFCIWKGCNAHVKLKKSENSEADIQIS